jgi:polysaccharide biosynthesis protein PelA
MNRSILITAGVSVLGLAVALTPFLEPAFGATTAGAPPSTARTVVALYDSRVEAAPRNTLMHQFIEMPLNYLGLVVSYLDIRDGFPSELISDPAIRGVISCYPRGTRLDNPQSFVEWAGALMQNGKRLLVMCDPGFLFDSSGKGLAPEALNKVLGPLGLLTDGALVSNTPRLRLEGKSEFINFEGPSAATFLPFLQTKADLNKNPKIILSGREEARNKAELALAVVTQAGGYVASDFGFVRESAGDGSTEVRWWYLNPFAFLEEVFSTRGLPKPDPTTVAGRRAFYAVLQGGGWNARSTLEKVDGKSAPLSPEVVLQEIVSKYSDFPLTLALEGAEIDPAWAGSSEAQAVAKKYAALPQVELASFTYSEPWSWRFFEKQDAAAEAQVAGRYPDPAWFEQDQPRARADLERLENGQPVVLYEGWPRPRRYAMQRFDLDLELKGTSELLRTLAPEKASGCLVWSGSKLPYDAAVRRSKELGLCSLGDGRSRLDARYPSYGWLEPLWWTTSGGDYVPYRSLAGESAFVASSDGSGDAFPLLEATLQATEKPRRVKPAMLGFEIEAGIQRDRLNAVKALYEKFRRSELCPISLQEYLQTIDGFKTVDFESCGPECWQVQRRGGLATVRFDEPAKQTVDLARSSGVAGFRRINDSLYVYLDRMVEPATIVLGGESWRTRAFLQDSRWPVWGVSALPDRLSFQTAGFGAGQMNWYVPWQGMLQLKVQSASGQVEQNVAVGADHIVSFMVPSAGGAAQKVELTAGGKG